MHRRERTAILGGTFTPVHSGHRALLHEAFQTASNVGRGDGHVVVGLTSTALARRTRDPEHADRLDEYATRCDLLEVELDRVAAAYSASHEVVKLEDPLGPAATREDVDALVVSPEAKAQYRAHELNERRREAGLEPLEVHTAPFVVAEDGVRISSTRIRNGEIDAYGRMTGE